MAFYCVTMQQSASTRNMYAFLVRTILFFISAISLKSNDTNSDVDYIIRFNDKCAGWLQIIINTCDIKTSRIKTRARIVLISILGQNTGRLGLFCSVN